MMNTISSIEQLRKIWAFRESGGLQVANKLEVFTMIPRVPHPITTATLFSNNMNIPQNNNIQLNAYTIIKK
jgi:hypothetical protein